MLFRSVLYSTWSRRGTPSTHQAALDAAYASLGRELGAVVAPVGAVWQRVHAAQPTLELYDPDGSHPSPAGSYLAGTVLWSALSGRLPEFLPSRLTGHLLVDTAFGTRLSDSLGVLAALPDGDARQVQHAAAEVFGEQKAAGGALATPMAGSMAGSISASMATPTASPLSLPAGRALTAEALLGTWSGTLRLFDQPAEMALRVSRRDGAFRGELTVRYAAGAGTRSTVVQDFAADGTTLRFTVADPRFLAPPEAYRAVLTGDTLVGVAEVGDPEHVPHLMGHWTLRRRP